MNMKITCTGKDMVDRKFHIHVRETHEGYPWFLVSQEEVLSDEFFELVLKPLGENSFMIMMMNANGVYGGLGIPDTLIPFLAQHLLARIRSSPARSEDGNYWRTEAATKVWKRLVFIGKAEYNKEEDIYHIAEQATIVINK